MKIASSPYGITAGGEHVTCYTLTNAAGVQARFLDYGCILTHLIVPDRSDRPVDVVLGYDELSSYEADPACMGALVGRYANRIKDAAFTLHGKVYHLTPNDGANHLHGVLGKRVFRAAVGDDCLRLTYTSPDGEDGLPGAVRLSVIYTLDDNNVLTMRYEAVSDADTVLNLTNHSYFNLAGCQSGCVDGQLLQIAADEFLETADDNCPTGHILPTAGAMDFRRLRRIGQGLSTACEQIELVGGYDHCYILRPHAAPAALAYCPETGIALTVVTTQPGLQLYTGNYLEDIPLPGKGGARYVQRGGFCLETEHYPCSPNFPQFPTAVLRAGEMYRQTTLYQLQVLERME
ncbi:MAG: galactose mutarotase [Ruminococcaceae bacterium]|jgi:aldose 1-epimerase|nr:galactose mutarotase [Oscillospiraceae bacterium]